MDGFTLTKISVERAVMFGGVTPDGWSSDVRVATIGQGSVVSECVLYFPRLAILAPNITFGDWH